MELSTTQQTGTSYYGEQSFSIAAGQSLTIETSPAGEDILDTETPGGKVRNVFIKVIISEVDA
jgi:hypothetical protein